MKRRPVIAMTMGDPAGVGPEVCLKAALDSRVRKRCASLIVGDAMVLRKHARRMKIPARLKSVPEEGASARREASAITPVLDLGNVAPEHRVFGEVLPELGRAAGEYVERAVSLARAWWTPWRPRRSARNPCGPEVAPIRATPKCSPIFAAGAAPS